MKLSVEERHGAVQNLTGDGFSKRQIAEVIGVSERTVAADRAELHTEPLDAIAELAATNEAFPEIVRNRVRIRPWTGVTAGDRGSAKRLFVHA